MTTETARRIRATAIGPLAAAMLTAAGTLLSAGSAAAQEARAVSLDEALETALRNNPSLLESRADVDAARSSELAAKGAFLPDVSLAYDYRKASTGRIDATGSAITTTSNTAELQGSLDLFQGLRRFRDLSSTRRRTEAEVAEVREVRWRTALDVKRAYFDAVARRELVGVQASRVERQRNQLEFVRARVEQGKATASDSLRSRVELNDARVALIQARNDAREARFALARAMGVRGPVRPQPEARLASEELAHGLPALHRIASETAPALEAARASAEAARAEVGASKSSYLPDFTLSGGYAWSSPGFPPQQRSWGVVVSASYPLFDGFRREDRVAQARSRSRAAAARRTRAELRLHADLDAAYHRVDASTASIDLAEESVTLNREDLRVTRERYRMGVATILELQTSQTELADAEANLVRRRLDRRLALAELEALLGRDLEDPGLAAIAGDDRELGGEMR